MSDLSANLALPYLMPAQAQKHVTHNEALAILDALVQLVVQDRDLAAPPALPAEGARYIVGAAGSGDWLGKDGQIALWRDGAWIFFVPQAGWRAEVLDEGLSLRWSGSQWEFAARQPLLGVNATPDTTTRFAVGAEASLFTHDGASHRLKVNKAASAETAALLFQTGWSGRAEMGLAGSDDFAIKVSADGSTWQTGLSLSAASGAPALAGGATIGGKTALHLGNVVGTVGLSGGAPTGAVLERGSSASGGWTRWADGTQLCWHKIDLTSLALSTGFHGGFRAASWQSWSFPAAFAAAPVVGGSALGGTSFGIGFDSVTASACGYSPLSITSSAAAARSLTLTAIGRWA